MAFYDIEMLRRCAAGRWLEILLAAGLPAKVLDGRNHPCPRCGGRDRFAAFRDLSERGAVHCRHCFTRGCAIRPGDGIATLRWWMNQSFSETLEFLAQQLGMAAGAPAQPSMPIPRRPKETDTAIHSEGLSQSVTEHTRFARQAYRRMDRTTCERLADHLGVMADAIRLLRVGVTADAMASTWPMRQASGKVIGVSIQALPWGGESGRKWSRRGSRSGIFMPRRTRHADPSMTAESVGLYITEGASDTAAALSLGLWVIGRASCSASTHFVSRYVSDHQPASVTIISDNDDAGRGGAKRLAKFLSRDSPTGPCKIDVIVPPSPCNDLRDWVSRGATRSDVKQMQPIASYHPLEQPSLEFE